MAKKIKFQIKSIYGHLLFEYEAEDNTLAETIRQATKSGSNLSGSDLRGSNLSYSDLSGSNLRGSDLRGSNLSEAKDADYAIAMTRILPEGSIIGWKKCQDGLIVKLRIPEEAKRSHAFGRKCRAEYAEVLEILGPKGGKSNKVAYSSFTNDFKYEVGKIVKPNKFDENWLAECSTGIHFFITREEAEKY